MTTSKRELFQPFSIGKLEIAGRLIKTATSETRASSDGFATPKHIEFYEPIAEGATPLIITGNIYTSRDGQSTPNQMGADGDDKIPALRSLTVAVHRHGSKIFAQLSHCGRQVLPAYVGLPESLSASAVADLSTGTKPRALRVEEIRTKVEEFGDAALRCQKAGFDGVQIHAGHGYLVSQFLTPYINRRNDEYGGSLENRVRFLREILGNIRGKTGSDFPVIMKLNGSDYLPLRRGLKTPELVEIARILEKDGLDGVEISVGHYESGFPVVRGTFWSCMRAMARGSARFLPLFRRLMMQSLWPVFALLFNLIWRRRQGYNLRYAREFASALDIPVICVGGFLTADRMESAIRDGDCDAVSAGRSFIANPHLYRQLRDNVEGPRCVFCNACVGLIGSQPLDCYHPEVRKAKDAMLAGFTSGGMRP